MFGRKPEASYEVDGSLLAGLLIKYEDKVIDASLSRQLKIIRNEITEELK